MAFNPHSQRMMSNDGNLNNNMSDQDSGSQLSIVETPLLHDMTEPSISNYKSSSIKINPSKAKPKEIPMDTLTNL